MVGGGVYQRVPERPVSAIFRTRRRGPKCEQIVPLGAWKILRYTLAPLDGAGRSSFSSVAFRGTMPEILTELFCERCGTRYTFESARQRVRLKRVKVLSRGVKNFVLSDASSMDEAMASARAETDRKLTTYQLDAFHQTFTFCMSCRQYTCSNCWNTVEARCLSCAPLAVTQVYAATSPVAGLDVANPALAANGSNGHAPEAEGVLAEGVAGEAGAEPVASVIERAEVEAYGPIAGETVAEPEVSAEAVDAAHAVEPVEAAVPVEAAEPLGAAEAVTAETLAAAATETVAAADVAEEVATGPDKVASEPVAEVETGAARPIDAVPVDRAAAAAAAAAAIVASRDTVDVGSKTAAQTKDLLRRFRPGQNLDAELEAYERDRAATLAAATPAAPPTAVEKQAAAAAATSSPAAAEPPTAIPAQDPKPLAAAAAALAGAAAKAVTPPASTPQAADRPEPIAEQTARSAEPARAAAEEATLPEGASSPDAVQSVERAQRRAAASAAATPSPAREPASTPPPRIEDIVVQPTWQRVAPDVTPDTPPVAPSMPAAASAASSADARGAQVAGQTRMAEHPGHHGPPVPRPSEGPRQRRRGGLGRLDPRGRRHPAHARQASERRSAVRQLRAVTVRQRQVLPALRDFPGLTTRRRPRTLSRTLTQAAPYSSAWNVNDNHASAMKADATEPARAATPTNRGTRNMNTWLRNTTASPTTTAGIAAERHRGALGGRSRYTSNTVNDREPDKEPYRAE